MKFILTGCTGFIGSEVLAQCLRNPSITSIVALSRRELPKAITDNPKLKVLIMKDFNTYSEAVIQDLSGADACIWCMGTVAGDKVLEIDYPLAFGNAFSKTLPITRKGFRYIHLSGMFVVRDQQASLWMKEEARKTKGRAEQNMLDFATKPETKGLWETLIVKPGFVTNKAIRTPRDLMGWAVGASNHIRVDQLAGTMIDAGFNGWKEDTILDNKFMGMKGDEYLKKIEIVMELSKAV